jgi:hypothetical protein
MKNVLPLSRTNWKYRNLESWLREAPLRPWELPEHNVSTIGDMMMKKPLLCMIAAVSLVALTSAAQAHSTYDGPWNLLFVTQRGACDPTYNFSVNITDGIVTHPNLVKFRGYVARSGATRASVTVHDKYASGSGRLSRMSGQGIWSGRSGNSRCTGYWTAQRN